MRLIEKLDRLHVGLIAGFLLPVISGLIVYFINAGNYPIIDYLKRIVQSGIITHSISLCVFSNIVIFLIFNRLDMLKAAKGVLSVTIVWALLVFGIYFLG